MEQEVTWQRVHDSTIERNGYRIVRSGSITAGVFVYHTFDPRGGLLCVGGDVSAEPFKKLCEEHERKRNEQS